MRVALHENEISGAIVDAAIEVHRTLGGPGLLEGYINRLWSGNWNPAGTM